MARPPFDPLRASFILVALVIGVHCLVVLLGTALCIYTVVAGEATECDSKGRLSDLLAGVLAAALAFSGGLRRRTVDEEPPPADKEH